MRESLTILQVAPSQPIGTDHGANAYTASQVTELMFKAYGDQKYLCLPFVIGMDSPQDRLNIFEPIKLNAKPKSLPEGAQPCRI